MGQLFNGNIHFALYCYTANKPCHPTCHQTFIGKLNIQYQIILGNMPTYFCQSKFMSVCLSAYFKSKSSVRITHFYKVICYVSIIFLLYCRGDPLSGILYVLVHVKWLDIHSVYLNAVASLNTHCHMNTD